MFQNFLKSLKRCLIILLKAMLREFQKIIEIQYGEFSSFLNLLLLTNPGADLVFFRGGGRSCPSEIRIPAYPKGPLLYYFGIPIFVDEPYFFFKKNHENVIVSGVLLGFVLARMFRQGG